jgi:hypothetical protein
MLGGVGRSKAQHQHAGGHRQPQHAQQPRGVDPSVGDVAPADPGHHTGCLRSRQQAGRQGQRVVMFDLQHRHQECEEADLDECVDQRGDRQLARRRECHHLAKGRDQAGAQRVGETRCGRIADAGGRIADARGRVARRRSRLVCELEPAAGRPERQRGQRDHRGQHQHRAGPAHQREQCRHRQSGERYAQRHAGLLDRKEQPAARWRRMPAEDVGGGGIGQSVAHPEQPFWMPFSPNKEFKEFRAAAVRARPGPVLLHARRARGDRRLGGLCSAWPPATAARDRPGGLRAAADAGLHGAVPARAPQVVRARAAHHAVHARGHEPRVLHQLGLRGGRHRDEDGARLPPRARPGPAAAVRVARACLPRRQHGRRGAGRHGQQPAQPSAPGLAGVYHMRHTALPQNRFVRGPARARRRPGRRPAALLQPVWRREHRGVFVEPTAGSFGCLPPPKGYLDRLRQICDCSTASCWCSTRSSPAGAAWARTSAPRPSASRPT